MTDFQPDSPRWQQVAEVIAQRITAGTYAPGTRVPSVLALSAEFGVAISTAQKAHRGLREEGLIHTQPGTGSFVPQQLPAQPTVEPSGA